MIFYYLNLAKYFQPIDGMVSVAHMNYWLAKFLSHKNIIFIGQDLAYSKDQSSHAKDFIHEKLHEGHFQKMKIFSQASLTVEKAR